jgi:hypothetical protein
MAQPPAEAQRQDDHKPKIEDNPARSPRRAMIASSGTDPISKRSSLH